MYRKPRFLKVLHAIREEMSREVDYDVDLFVAMVRAGEKSTSGPMRNVRAFRSGKETPGEIPIRQRKVRRRLAR